MPKNCVLMIESLIDRLGARSFALSVASFVLMIDQMTKYLSTHYLRDQSFRIFNGFDLVLSYNTGAAFSFLAAASGWQRWFFIGLALVFSAGILFYLGRLRGDQQQEILALSLILGGAVGNLIDRLLYGHVIDFILWYYQYWQWPAFNIADSAICMGMILWFPSCFKVKKTA